MQKFKTNKQNLKLEIVNQKLKQLSLFITHLRYVIPSIYNVSKLIMYSTNVGLTFLLINRWINSGHFPLSNLYESLIFLSWSFTIIYTIVSFTLRNEAKITLLPIISWCAVPITLFTCGYAFFCVPQELQKAESLVPALQSNWLIMHVSVMILSYASLILGSLFAFSLLLTVIFDTYKWKMVSPAIFGVHLKMLRAPSPKAKGQQRGTPLLTPSVIAPGFDIKDVVADTVGVAEVDGLTEGNKTGFITFDKAELDGDSKENAHVAYTSGVAFGDGSSKASGLEYKQNYTIKNHNFLDNLSYRFIGLGFALLTLGIISGAVWANSAWGSYWSWDPKETWAFITWLTYAIYLHLRISQGWYGKQSAYVAFFGFFVVWFCYLGVNLFGKGLHSYAFV